MILNTVGGEKVKDVKIETKVEIKNETKEKATLYLYGNIRQAWGSWEGEDIEAITSKKVRQALERVGNKDLDVHLNTKGGDVFESIAIHNILKAHKGTINIFVDALAGSGGSVIAMAGDKIYMPSNAMMMIHKAWTWAAGNAKELRKMADDLEKIDISVKESYKARFVGTEEELIDLIDEESWLTADECKTLGFCDEVLKEKEDDEEIEDRVNVKVSLLEKYKDNPGEGEERKSNILNNFKRSEQHD